MVHCEAFVQAIPLCGKAGTVLLQLRQLGGVQRGPGGLNAGWPRSIVPPSFPDAGQPPSPGLQEAPDGSTATLPAEPFWGPLSMNALAKSVVYVTLDPPRSTVVPLPVTSQAKPTRGEKSL